MSKVEDKSWPRLRGKGTFLHTVGENVNQNYEKQCGGSLKKLKMELPPDPPHLPLHMYSKEMKSVHQRDSTCPSLTLPSQQPRNGNDLSVHQLMNGQRKGVQTHDGTIFSHKKRVKFSHS